MAVLTQGLGGYPNRPCQRQTTPGPPAGEREPKFPKPPVRGNGAAARATSAGGRIGRVALHELRVGGDRAQVQHPAAGHVGFGRDVGREQGHRAQPARVRKSGSAAASATPARMPTEVSRAELTTAGSPASATISSARRTPPSGGDLDHDQVRGVCAGHRERVRLLADAFVRGNGDADPRRAHRSARSRRSPSMPGPAARRTPGRTRPAGSAPPRPVRESQPPFASTRSAASGSSRRTAATRATSSSAPGPPRRP